MKVLLIVTLLFFTTSAWTQDSVSVDKAVDTVNVDGHNDAATKPAESNYFVYGYYSWLDLIIPSKIGVSAGKVLNPEKTFELEYLQGSISVPFIIKDLGKVSDHRLTIVWRSYYGGTLNLSYGLAYHKINLHLGDALLAGLTGGAYPSVDLVEVSSVGPYIGIGNRWIFNKNFSFGVDWLGWSQPLLLTSKKSAFLDYTTNQKDKDDVDNALKVLSYFPRFMALKIHLGVLF